MKRTMIVLGIMAASFAYSQVLSPAAKTSVTISGKKLVLAYSSPAMRGRKIMGGLVPFGQVWRTGADNATTFMTDANLLMGDEKSALKVPKGVYTIFTLPNSKEWLLIVNKQTGQWGTEYHPEQDLGRVKMSVVASPAPLDRLKIELLSAGGNKGLLKISWEKTEASVPITVQ